MSDLINVGIIRPPLKLEKTYKNRELTAEIQSDGRVAAAGKVHDTLSAAAVAAMATVTGKTQAADGWTFWSAKDESGALVPVSHLRRCYRDGKR